MKQTFSILTGALAVAVAVGAARAQEMSPEDMKKWAQYSNPGDLHKQLEPLIGGWQETVRFWFAPGTDAVESASTSEAEWIMDGRWVKQEHDGSAMGQPFHGFGLLGYDNYREEYVSIWIDNMSTAAMITRGTYDPVTNTMTMTGTVDDFMGGKSDVPLRTVMHWKDPDTAVYEMYAPGPDGTEFMTLEVTGRRVKGAEVGR